jgi:predicted Zn finger-like uncharacterized protein
MIITCGQCQARFKVAPEQIKVTGSKVRCSNCHFVFTVYRPGGPGAEGRPERGDELGREPAENPDLSQDEETASPQARRERRRRLSAGPDEAEDDSSADEGWEEAGLDEDSGRPPLRRRAAPSEPLTSPEPPRAEAPEEPGDEGSYRAGQAGPGPPAAAADDLGLAADPTRPGPAAPRQVGEDEDEDLPPLDSGYGGGEIRAAVTRVKGRRGGLFLALAIFCAALAIGLYYLSGRPEPLALSGGDGPPLDLPIVPGPAGGGETDDPRGIVHITFTPKDNLKHFYRRNEKEGELLIITGRVRNSYPKPRSFVRLRGLLLDQHGNTLADRFIYAGNLISEEDLLTLPKDEIMARLNIKGGQNNQNVNIAPGQEVPFMVVFDKVPPNKDEYRIIPVGSSPAANE